MLAEDSVRSRQAEATRLALIAAARKLFAARGYHAVGVRELAAAAGVTHGAFRHHFVDKESLFAAVFEAVQNDRVAQAALRHREPTRPDRWTQLRRDLQVSLDEAMKSEVQQIALIDGPSVLGWTRWRTLSATNGVDAIAKGLEESMKAGFIRHQPVRPLAMLISGATKEAALAIANASQPDATREEVGAALEALLRGLE